MFIVYWQTKNNINTLWNRYKHSEKRESERDKIEREKEKSSDNYEQL